MTASGSKCGNSIDEHLPEAPCRRVYEQRVQVQSRREDERKHAHVGDKHHGVQEVAGKALLVIAAPQAPAQQPHPARAAAGILNVAVIVRIGAQRARLRPERHVCCRGPRVLLHVAAQLPCMSTMLGVHQKDLPALLIMFASFQSSSYSRHSASAESAILPELPKVCET